MKRAREPEDEASHKRAKHEQECHFFTIPPELLVLVRGCLGVDDRHRLLRTCHAACAEEPPSTFDFPEQWLQAIRGRPESGDDGNEKTSADIAAQYLSDAKLGRVRTARALATTRGWLTDGDMARGLWSLGWHRWPGMANGIRAVDRDEDNKSEPFVIRLRQTSFELAYRYSFYYCGLVWARVGGISASGIAPLPFGGLVASQYDSCAFIGLFATYGDAVIPMVVDFFKCRVAQWDKARQGRTA